MRAKAREKRDGTPGVNETSRPVILCLDVDGAPFIHRDLLALEAVGYRIHQAPSRPIPAEWLEGDLARLIPLVVRRGPVAPATLFDSALAIVLRPGALWLALRVLARLAPEPRMFARFAATLPWTLSWIPWVRRHGVTHIHANWAHLPATSAWVLSRSTGIPFSFAGHAGRDLFRTTALLREKVDAAQFIVVCNEAAANQLRTVAPESSTPIYVRSHGVDTDAWRPGSADRRGLLAVGTLVPAKGFDTLIRALVPLSRDRDDARLTIVGEGPEGPLLRRLAESLGVADRIAWRGRLGSTDLLCEYQAAAVLVVPSRLLPNGGRDGLPNVVLEGMACGLPVVGSNVGGIPEAVRDRRIGRLVEPEDPDALAGAIDELLSDDVEREAMGSRARVEVETRYALADARREWAAVFGEMIGLAATEEGESVPEARRADPRESDPRSSS